jgi:hypothetical protein
MPRFTWKRYGGYECSSHGDHRFSALFAVMPDGRTIEQHYQCDIKGYEPGGKNWRIGKGKPPIRDVDLWNEYLNLWKIWASTHIELLRELYTASKAFNFVLSDKFATSDVNQARALATILNELCEASNGTRIC